MSFWWCLSHGVVEGGADDEPTCALIDRLGPYDTHEQAGRALESTRARTEAEDARDRADDDWGR